MDLIWARGELWANEIFVDSSYIVAAAVAVAAVEEYDDYYYCMDYVDIDIADAVVDDDEYVVVVAIVTYAYYCALTVFDAENNDYYY
jgi:hypothetical protein